MFCPKCGKELAPTGKFCKYCGTPVEQYIRGTVQEERKEDIPSAQKKQSEKTISKDTILAVGEFGTLGIVVSLTIKIIIILAIARVFLYVCDNLGMLGGTLVIFNSSAVSTGIMIIGFLEIGMATFTKKYPSGKIDRLFLLLPLVPVILIAVLVILNLGTFLGSLGVVEGIFALVVLDGGFYFCNMTYTVRFRKKILKEKMSEMSDEEIEELKEYTSNPDEIDKLKAEMKQGEK